MYVSNRPFDIRSVLSDVDVVTCHSGHGMVSSCLQAGRPMILLPTQLEQRHTSLIIEKMGIGIVIDINDSEEIIISKFNEFFSSPRYAEKAKSFAFENRHLKPSETLTFISEACTSLLRKD
jgi:UDP:flavonoid glycosyltransferase YjiC (YdhE family)